MISAGNAWQVLAHDEPTAAAQMAYDHALALAGIRTFRVFRWSRLAVSVGWKQPWPAWMGTAAFRGLGIEVVERPTGGGVTVHGSDVSCSVVVPSGPGVRLHEVMARMAGALAEGLGRLGASVHWLGSVPASQRVVYCLAETSSYALMSRGRKLCGFAVRRFPGTLLIQGSMLVGEMPAPIRNALPEEARRSYQARAITLEEAIGRAMEPEIVRHTLLKGWRAGWAQTARNAARAGFGDALVGHAV